MVANFTEIMKISIKVLYCVVLFQEVSATAVKRNYPRSDLIISSNHISIYFLNPALKDIKTDVSRGTSGAAPQSDLSGGAARGPARRRATRAAVSGVPVATPRCPPCAPPLCSHPYFYKGECCPRCPQAVQTYRGCYDSTYRRLHGFYSTFVPAEDHCRVCTCHPTGDIICEPKQCPLLPENCKDTTTPAGKCCPICRKGCSYDGQWYNVGAIVPRHHCEYCFCILSGLVCHPKACPTVKCRHPEVKVGDCCPTCPPGCWDEGSGIYHPVGPVKSANPCQYCMCTAGGNIRCAPIHCAPPNCNKPVKLDSQCCPTCKGPNGICWDNIGHDWIPEGPIRRGDPCELCICKSDGEILCEVTKCTSLPCPHPVRRFGECCPVCEGGCWYEHKWIPRGYSKPVPGSCERCHCIAGKILSCEALSCPGCEHAQCRTLHCEKQVLQPGHCCPMCDDYYPAKDDFGHDMSQKGHRHGSDSYHEHDSDDSDDTDTDESDDSDTDESDDTDTDESDDTDTDESNIESDSDDSDDTDTDESDDTDTDESDDTDTDESNIESDSSDDSDTDSDDTDETESSDTDESDNSSDTNSEDSDDSSTSESDDSDDTDDSETESDESDDTDTESEDSDDTASK